MDTKASPLSIIIVNWNTCSLLLKCLNSIFVHPKSESFEVVVVDNASQDDSVVAIRKKFPQVKVIVNSENRGFAAACNQGIVISTGKFVGLLNPDTEIKTDALFQLVHVLDTEPACLAAGPQLLNPDGSLQPSGRRFPSFTQTVLDGFLPERIKHTAWWRKKVFGRLDFQQPAQVDELSGACFITRREVLNKNGLLDEGYYIYFEEVDWFKRLQKLPGHVLYQPAAQVMHHWSASISQCGHQALRWHYAALFRYGSKHHGWLWTLGIRQSVFFQAIVGIVAHLIMTCLFLKPWYRLFKTWQRYGVMMQLAMKGR